ncbi:MAG: F0F1 ATP synthase subunit B [Paludibacter sp.]|nr:F0F1 ATP synthase subunit B [Paludibacter sp.]
MSLLTPDSGLLFWMLLTFGIVVFILAKYGFPVIVKMVEERKQYINDSLIMAEKARTELDKVKAEGEAIMDEARKEHLKLMQETAKTQEALINEAKEKAAIEADKLIADAKIRIQEEKNEALREVRRQVAELSVDIAEKVIKNKLSEEKEQVEMINRLLDEINISKS